MTPCSPLKLNRVFRGKYHLHFLRWKNGRNMCVSSRKVAVRHDASKWKLWLLRLFPEHYPIWYHMTKPPIASELFPGWYRRTHCDSQALLVFINSHKNNGIRNQSFSGVKWLESLFTLLFPIHCRYTKAPNMWNFSSHDNTTCGPSNFFFFILIILLQDARQESHGAWPIFLVAPTVDAASKKYTCTDLSFSKSLCPIRSFL